MNSTFVSIVVPAYNEGSSIEATLETLVRYLRSAFSRFEVIAVDDGSTDDTSRKISEAAKIEPCISHLSLPTNRGKGFAVRQGILQAKGEAICFTDADLSTPVEAIEQGAIALQRGFPVVIASRGHPESIIALRQDRAREAIGKTFNLAVRTLLSLPFHDTQCGFKCFSREAAQAIFSRARIDGFAFDVEILVIARRLGYRVKEIPVTWTNSPDSKVRPVRHLPPVVRDLLRIYWNDRQELYRPHRSLGS